MNQWRQGDVIVRPAVIPEDVKEKGDLIIARGESTGHTHRITKGNTKLFVGNGTNLFLKVYDTATLGHEEHGDIVLPAGTYAIRTQREWDWFNEEVKNVID